MSVETAQLGRANEARLTIKVEGGQQHAKLSGHWTADQAPAIERFVSEVLDSAKARMPVVLDLASIERLDTIGAWIIDRTLHDLRSRGAKGELVGVQPKHEALLREVEAHGLHAARRESEDDAPELLVGHCHGNMCLLVITCLGVSVETSDSNNLARRSRLLNRLLLT
ncbi:Anti-anti-sigma regulatory factor (antagonist of anti-sigma factor) [Rhizobiales bacterium GAS188]|nr:Anti-anti-sigma regulatory factor (antagonist of anti-sigma factor) [Rhizobiales bacterium GAS188]